MQSQRVGRETDLRRTSYRYQAGVQTRFKRTRLAVFNRKGGLYKFSVPVSAFGIKDEKQLLAMRDIWTGEKLNIVDGTAYINMEIWQCFFC